MTYANLNKVFSSVFFNALNMCLFLSVYVGYRFSQLASVHRRTTRKSWKSLSIFKQQLILGAFNSPPVSERKKERKKEKEYSWNKQPNFSCGISLKKHSFENCFIVFARFMWYLKIPIRICCVVLWIFCYWNATLIRELYSFCHCICIKVLPRWKLLRL
jgi:hypothetical protein